MQPCFFWEISQYISGNSCKSAWLKFWWFAFHSNINIVRKAQRWGLKLPIVIIVFSSCAFSFLKSRFCFFAIEVFFKKWNKYFSLFAIYIDDMRCGGYPPSTSLFFEILYFFLIIVIWQDHICTKIIWLSYPNRMRVQFHFTCILFFFMLILHFTLNFINDLVLS